MKASEIVAYWDASAILSYLLNDVHTKKAGELIKFEGYHLMSTLAYSEVYSVLARLKKARHLSEHIYKKASQIVESGLWQYVNISPLRNLFHKFAVKCSLKGADLWHLAMAQTLKKELPELTVISFDGRLNAACERENLLNEYCRQEVF